MVRSALAAITAALLLAQIAGCHYYVNAVPRIIISSEAILLTEQTPNHQGETQQ